MVIYLLWSIIPHSYRSLYGDRLDGIEDVKLEQSDLNKVAEKLESKDGVDKASSNLKGRLINFEVTLEKDQGPSTGKELGSTILKAFDKEELEYYDIQLFIDGKSDKLPVIGYKHKTSNKFVWSNNK